MGLFRRKKDEPKEEAPPSPQVDEKLGLQNKLYCTLHEPWKWVVEMAGRETWNLSLVEVASDLPTGKVAAAQAENQNDTQKNQSGRRRKKKPQGPCILRLEICDSEGRILDAAHGTSEAFDGLEDKDELVRTMQRCRCEHLHLSPPSRLLNWDVTKEECKNLVGDSMPALVGNKSNDLVAVLKEPTGRDGAGIYFVRDADEIHEIMEEKRKQAVEEPNYLDNLITAKGRIPSWVLQAEVYPPLLIRQRRKFHIRTYVVCLEQLYSDSDELVENFVYNRHEVRIAGKSVPTEEGGRRDRTAHITNSAVSEGADRVLLQDEPELSKRKLQQKVELFIAKMFSEHFSRDISRRVSISADNDDSPIQVKKFAVAGLDIMMTDDEKLYLLEVNVNPSVPSRKTLDTSFESNLTGLMKDLFNLTIGNEPENFVSTREILGRDVS